MSKPLMRIMAVLMIPCFVVHLAGGEGLSIHSNLPPTFKSLFEKESLSLELEFVLHPALENVPHHQSVAAASRSLFDAEDGMELFDPQMKLVGELIRDRPKTFGTLMERLDLRPEDDLPGRLEKVRQFRDMLSRDAPLGSERPNFLQTLRKKYGRGWPAPTREETDRPSCLDNLADYIAILEMPPDRRDTIFADVASDSASIERALRIFYDEYIFNMIQLAVPRICELKDFPSRAQREQEIGQRLKDLKDPRKGASGQTFDVSVPFLMSLPGSSLGNDERAYVEIARHYPGRAGNSISAHLRTLLRRVKPKTDNQFHISIKKNSLDYALQILHVRNRLKDYEELKMRPTSDPLKQEVVEDLLNFVAAHPYVMSDIHFLMGIKNLPRGQNAPSHPFYPSDLLPEEVESFHLLLERNRLDLAFDIAQMPWLYPARGRFSPLATGDLSLKPLMRSVILTSALFSGYEHRTLEDSFVAERFNEGGAKLAWRNRLETVLNYLNQERQFDYGEDFYLPYDHHFAVQTFVDTVLSLCGIAREKVKLSPRKYYEENIAPQGPVSWGALPRETRAFLEWAPDSILDALSPLGRYSKSPYDGSGGWEDMYITVPEGKLWTRAGEELTNFFSSSIPTLVRIFEEDVHHFAPMLLEFLVSPRFNLFQVNSFMTEGLEMLKDYLGDDFKVKLPDWAVVLRWEGDLLMLTNQLILMAKRLGPERWEEALAMLKARYSIGQDLFAELHDTVWSRRWALGRERSKELEKDGNPYYMFSTDEIFEKLRGAA